MNSMWRRTWLTAVLGGGLLLGGIVLPRGVAQAHEQDRQCFERIRREQFKLERDIERHGFFSRQAEHRRLRIRSLRERCFERRHGRRFDDDDDDRGERHHRGRWHQD